MAVFLLIHAIAWAAVSTAEAAPPPELPSSGAAPLGSRASAAPATASGEPVAAGLPVDGADPLREQNPAEDEAARQLPPDGADPLGDMPGQRDPPGKVDIRRPLGSPDKPRRALSPRRAIMTRVDVMTGPMWRTRPVDAWLAASVESGRAHGFSGAFAIGVLPASSTGVINAVDVPMSAGAIARGRLRRRPLYASVGLLAGVMIHHAKTAENGVVRRVDPDFRLPIRFAWTIASIGLSLALEQGFSVRDRSYERRGAVVWARKAYRVGLSIGLHWDIVHKSSKRRPGRGRS